MTALHRVKAYFGMVPADELDAYDGYGERPGDRHADRHAERYDDRYEDRGHERPYERPVARGRWDDRDDRDDRYDRMRGDGRRDVRDDRDADDRAERAAARRREVDELPPVEPAPSRPRTPRPRDPEHTEHRLEESDPVDTTSRTPRGRGWAHNTGPNHTSVRPSPSLSSSTRSVPSLSPVPPNTSGPAGNGAAARSGAGEGTTRSRGADAAAPDTPGPAEITSLQPTSYNEARVIGERYRDGIPVIMNLSDLDDVAAKRLVDFAAGLAFALRGSIEKVTNRVFLLSPPHVEVSAADRRKLVENGFSASS